MTAQAHHRSGHNGGLPHRPYHQSEPGRSTTEAETDTEHDTRRVDKKDARREESAPELTAAQRTFIESLLQNADDETLLSADVRADIQAQIDALPPGIQRRLARGRRLPPGIAKKVYLPEQVNEQIDLNEDIRIIVVGRDVAVVAPVTDLIIDVIRDVLL